MKKPINENLHGFLDYVTAIGFAVLPAILAVGGYAAWLCYALAVIHLIMTLLTRMNGGVFKIIPIRLHAFVELMVGPTLILAGLLGSSVLGPEAWVFLPAGVLIFLVWLFSDYHRYGPGVSK